MSLAWHLSTWQSREREKNVRKFSSWEEWSGWMREAQGCSQCCEQVPGFHLLLSRSPPSFTGGCRQSVCSFILLPSLFFFHSCFPSLILSFRIFILKEKYNLILIKRTEVYSGKGQKGTFNRKNVFASLQSPTCYDKILLFSSKIIFIFDDYTSID